MKRELFSGFLVISLLISMLGLAFNTRSGKAEAGTETHDLEVTLSHSAPAKYHVSSGNSATVNATVVNKGNVNESNVTLLLLINDTVYLNATAQKLLPNVPFWATYLWTPEDGVWNLTVYAPPLPSEGSNTTNNVAQKLVNVCADASPTASFSYSPKLPSGAIVWGENVTFDASISTDLDDWGNITTYSWNLTGTPKNSSVPTSTYNGLMYGSHTVNLTVYDTEGRSAWNVTPIKVCARPWANFTINKQNPYVNDTLTFNAGGSFDPDNDSPGIATYTWDFNDSTLVTENQPITNHNYTTPGTYNVSLTVTDSDDNLTNWNLCSMNVTVNLGRPIASYTVSPSPSYVGHSLTFNATASIDPTNSSAPNHGIATYTWDFNDSTLVTENQPITNHNYTTPGTYNVSLTVTDSDQGLNGSTINIVAVYFEVLLKVVDSETGNNYSIHDPGETFKINITVNNVVDLDYFEFTLTYPAGKPSPLLKGEKIEDGDARAPLNDTRISDVQGQIQVDSNTHLGRVNGSFTLAIITFNVTNPGNCTLHISHSMLRNTTGGNILHTRLDADFMTDKPVANFTYKPPSPTVNQDVEFDASSSYDPGNMTLLNKGIANYTWDFKDGNITTTPNPIITHNYTEPGNYNVNLTVTDHEGKTSSFNKTISAQIFTHDVAILYAGPPWFLLNHTSGLYETSGELPINVTVMNNGTAPEETFDVTVYAKNATGFLFEIGSQTVTLNNTVPQENLTFCLCAFKWNGTRARSLALSTGNYTVSANATVVESDTDPNNNLYRCEGIIVRVHLEADVSGGDEPGVPDKKCDMEDIAYLVTLFNTKPPPPSWNPDADLDGNGVVDMRDIAIAIAYFNIREP